MTWKRILLHQHANRECGEPARVAIALARRFGAGLSALHTNREIAVLKHLLGSEHEAVKSAAAMDAPLMRAAESRFVEACRDAGVAGTIEVGEGSPLELVNVCGRTHDLIVVEQSTMSIETIGSDLVEEAAVSCGTPLLIVPRDRVGPVPGQRILVAWNNSRQSASAVHGALPLISAAQHVVALEGRSRDVTASITRWPRHDIGAYLRAHARSVEVVPFDPDNATSGEALLAAAERYKCDLLVMGAYGRSAWREFLFGGATRHVIAHTTVPVLMAH